MRKCCRFRQYFLNLTGEFMDTINKTGIDYWKKIVVVMSLGWVAIWIYRTVLTPIYPEIQASLGNVSNAEIGAIASFYFLAYCGMQIPCGILVDKLGQKIMLMCGFSLFIIGTLSIANAGNLTLIYIGSLLAGVGAPISSRRGKRVKFCSDIIPPD